MSDQPHTSLEEPLLAAIRRVSSGDFVTPVLVDDHGLEVLAASFNQMLDDLRDHDNHLREASTRIAAASDLRRRQAERELHDGVQQHLALIGLKLALLRGKISSDPAGAEELCETLNGSLQAALRELRELAHWIYPAVLENEGLAAALPDAGLHIPISIRYELNIPERYSADVEGAVYFSCVEALRNTAKHAGEGVTATVTIHEREGALVFEVTDDGVGFEFGADQQREGLQHVIDRVEALGGNLLITSSEGHGTTIRGEIPLAR